MGGSTVVERLYGGFYCCREVVWGVILLWRGCMGCYTVVERLSS